MSRNQIKSIRIGDVLLEMNVVTEEQVRQALAYRDEHEGMRTGDALLELGFITERQMLQALGTRLGYAVADPSLINVDMEALAVIPQSLAEKYLVLGYAQDDTTYYMMVNDPMNVYGIEDVRQIVGKELSISLVEKTPLTGAIGYYYSELAARTSADRAAEDVRKNLQEMDFAEVEGDTPIIRLLNSLLQRAYNANASDIHVEPMELETMVRMRMDGVMAEFMKLQKDIHASLIARIKILADLDIAEKRMPQDGHFRVKIMGDPVNVRVSIVPTVYGEKAVLRLLTNTLNVQWAERFGMEEDKYQLVRQMMRSPHGMIYVTGPTGSGKTTTLYMMLAELAKGSVNICTIEDPVEKNLPRLNQMQVNPAAGLTFEKGLRAILRQDPDIIMVGETRDAETAQIAVRAAITGHLVLSTLHTNDAASAVIRLADMGVEPYLTAGSLVGVIAQRLVRRVCPECGVWDSMTLPEVQILGKRLPKIKRPVGCRQCNQTGYSGRIAVHEILPVNKRIRKLITDGATTDEIKEMAISELRMETLRQQALRLVEDGVTTLEELEKVAAFDE